ncbi:hypothetical protein V8E36_009108 [Tilletia maclaganii]
MQLKLAHILAVFALASAALASAEGHPAAAVHGLHATHHARAASESTTRQGIQRIEADLASLKALKAQHKVDPEKHRAILDDLKKHTAEASASLHEVLHKYKKQSHKNKRAGIKRQDEAEAAEEKKRHVDEGNVLTPAVKGLIVDFHDVLYQADKTVTELASNLGLGKLSPLLVQPLYRLLSSVASEVGVGLLEVAPEFSDIYDPLVHTINDHLLDVVGLHLRSTLPIEDARNEDLLSLKARTIPASAQAAAEAKVQAHLSKLTHTFARLTRLNAHATAQAKVGGQVNLDAAAPALIKDALGDSVAAALALTHVFQELGGTAKAGVGAAVSVGGAGSKAATKAVAAGVGGAVGVGSELFKRHVPGSVDINETIFGKALYRGVHDLICVLHAVIKLVLHLVSNAGLPVVSNLLHDAELLTLEPVFWGLKVAAKAVGLEFSPLFDPIIWSAQQVLSLVGI